MLFYAELIWMGMKTLINNYRKKKLHIEKCLAGSQIIHDAEIPHIYCMSPSLAVKPSVLHPQHTSPHFTSSHYYSPQDWGKHIDVVGFWTLSGSGDTNYTPPKELTDFLANGEAPIYIGFGSIVVDDPDELTKTIFTAVAKAGVRAIISQVYIYHICYFLLQFCYLYGINSKGMGWIRWRYNCTGECVFDWRLSAHVAIWYGLWVYLFELRISDSFLNRKMLCSLSPWWCWHNCYRYLSLHFNALFIGS